MCGLSIYRTTHSLRSVWVRLFERAVLSTQFLGRVSNFWSDGLHKLDNVAGSSLRGCVADAGQDRQSTAITATPAQAPTLTNPGCGLRHQTRTITTKAIIATCSLSSMSSPTMLDESLAWLDSILEADDTSNGFLTAAAPISDQYLSPHGPRFGQDQHSPYSLTPSVHSPSSSTTSHSQSPLNQLPVADSSPDASSSTSAPTAKPPRRRIRPKIALDPNQPLTARGKPRARVYVACNQW